ncbi:MAG: glycosyltransferase family 4 protein [Halieaceae bacterium]|nr:glycosyltransferase family 4 protein [Halieaceae bacterium]
MLILFASFCLSLVVCGVYLKIARAQNILDIPNERSSHTLATPRGGGIGLMLSFSLGCLLAGYFYSSWDSAYVTLVLAALSLSVIGFLDDVNGLPMRLRFFAYSVTCVLVTCVLVPSSSGFFLGTLGAVFAALTLFWALNLFNFMDGIDGIAAVQTIMVCIMAAVLASRAVDSAGYVLFCLLLAGCHAGFLVWNFPPSRLFLGDSGSVPTGFLLGGLAIIGSVDGVIHPASWLVLMAVFITDATCTLLWRIVTGQPFTEAHRLHGYQRLSRRWDSHLRVDVLLVVVNVLWLFPIACAVQYWPQTTLFMVILAYLPLLLGMAKVGKLA